MNILKKIRTLLGRLYRGIEGLLHTYFEHVPKISPEITSEIIGQSVERRDICLYRLGNGPQKILLHSGIHGNEVGTIKLMHHLMKYLLGSFANYSQLTFYCIPCLNPDGYALAKKTPHFFSGGNIGRWNAKGVDLNRNFPTQDWQSVTQRFFGKNFQEAMVVFGGMSPASEPETQALIEFIKNNPIDAYIEFHSRGSEAMSNSTEISNKMADVFCQETGFTSYHGERNYVEQHGTALTWCTEQEIPFLNVEASVRWGSDWKKQRSGILALFDYLNSA